MVNKVYVNPETALVFNQTGTSAVFMGADVANAAGRKSAQLDRGTGAKPGRYAVWATCKFVTAAPTIGALVRFYLAEGFGTGTDQIAGNPGTTDAAVTAETDFNGWSPLGALVVDAASTARDMVQFLGYVEISARYINVGLWNASGGTVDADDGEDSTFVTLVPVPDEIQ